MDDSAGVLIKVLKVFEVILKGVRNHNGKYFFCPLKTVIFQTKFTLSYIKLNICMKEVKLTSHKKYLFGGLFPRNAKKTHTQTKLHYKFFTLSELKWITNLQK